VQAGINRSAAPPELPPLRELLRRHITRSTDIPEQYTNEALTALASLPDGSSLCHGDFHPGNVMMDGDEAVVIDWTNCARGAAEADFARTRMMMRLGEPPPGTSRALKLLALFGRRIFLVLYERGYRGSLALDEDLLHRWELPVAVARLTDDIQEERASLFKLIEALIARR
jgi:aminoglycoside phosphotransferase (APT) family kinase protein